MVGRHRENYSSRKSEELWGVCGFVSVPTEKRAPRWAPIVVRRSPWTIVLSNLTYEQNCDLKTNDRLLAVNEGHNQKTDAYLRNDTNIVLCATLFLIGSYFLTDQPLGIRAIQFWALHILLSLCGQALGFVAGAAFDAQMGLFMVISVAVPLFLFSGFYVRLNDVPGYLEWLTHVSSFRYSFEGGIVAIYGNNRSKLECSQPYCHYRNSSKILDDFNMSDATYENDLLAINMGGLTGGRIIKCVRFADNMALLAEETTILRDMLLEINDSCEQYGMKINANKTKIMVIGRKVKKKKEQLLRTSGERTKEETSEVLCVECSIVCGRNVDLRREVKKEAFEMWMWKRMERVKWRQNKKQSCVGKSDNASEMSRESNTESYPAFAVVGFKKAPEKTSTSNLFQPRFESEPGRFTVSDANHYFIAVE
ncbi:hypothetical protein ANN_22163 [Periplaneta americana]|uniref:ABC-2 type transporter transmembrane domain-containing protein n=1 Tax=Periplaneta americana TaxID=6978 RepID=A0ABQ8S7E2_PERAM|nr:hypothetical protein ANN_22163 [Periplaneta americana]